ncbi:right-handed parallel beta-helix repeat-containing protein [bacterium]|nr:right-handed parallel beta-helix repeat-containing protein [bacterium]
MRQTKLFILFLFFTSAHILNPQPQTQTTDVYSLVEPILKKADTYLNSRDYNSARKEYLKIKEYKDLDYAAQLSLFNIAETYRLEKKYSLAHQTYNEILKTPNLSLNYRIYSLFTQASLYLEENNYTIARKIYSDITKTKDVSQNQIFKAEMYTGDTYRFERKYTQSRRIYEKLLKQEDSSSNPNENYRLELVDRLENIEGLKDGEAEKSIRENRVERINSPKYHIYVSLKGSDTNQGTKEFPFQTIKRAQEEIKSIKKNKGIPQSGIGVYLRGGKYFITEGLKFNQEDSGEEGAPIVYRSYPGEEVRIIGGKQVTNFKPLKDSKIIRRLPNESKTKVWVSDLKEVGINNYGNLINRGHSSSPYTRSGMELFYNTRPMSLSRWPDEGWERVLDLIAPQGDGKILSFFYQKGQFKYSGDRPKRWIEEKDIWVAGYFLWPWDKIHTSVIDIDTNNKIINLAPDVRQAKSYPAYDIPVVKGTPYYFYNILSEISKPEEFYIDREDGKLYFYPPARIEGSEIIVSTLNEPIVELQNVSDIIFFNLTFECTWHNGLTLNNCTDILIAGSTIRNTGTLGAVITKGKRNGIVGCDIYDTGEGGLNITGGNRESLLPSEHYIENNHIHHFGRFTHAGGKYGIGISGVGSRASHNLVHDFSGCAINFSGNNQVVEYNEIYNVMYEARDGGAIYSSGAPRYLMNRGNVMRYNFIHNITEHSSPLKTHQVTGIYIDSLNGGMTMEGNIFYRCTERAMFTHGPDTQIKNNVFADCNIGISQSNRTSLLREDTNVKRWAGHLNTVFYRQPPWSGRYPQVRDFLKKKPYGEPKNVIIQENIFSNVYDMLRIGGNFTYADNSVKNNFEKGAVFFKDKDNLNFTIRVGSPVYGETEHTPVPFEEIGLYKDELRATWPVKKSPAGKYYNPDWKPPVEDISAKFPPLKRISREKEYKVTKRVNPIKIDGILNKEEWFGLDKKRAIPVVEEHKKGLKREPVGIYVWVTYDEDNIYLGIEYMPDPWKEGLPKNNPYVSHEFGIEGVMGQNTWWWQEGVPTGPLYVFTGRPDGTFVAHNLFNIPANIIRKLQEQVEYKSIVIDKDTSHWTSEWKLPISLLNINLKNNNTVRFNIGGCMRDGWFAWVATGGNIWRVDTAGVFKFQ